MKDFKKGGFGGGRSGGFNDRKPFGGKPSFGGKPDFKKSWDKPRGGSDDRPMFDAVCSNCGKACQVPFRPSGGKEVFCNDCFGKMKGDETFERGDRNDRHDSRGGFQDRAPRAPQGGGQNLDAVVRQLQVVASKLDQLISMTASNAKSATAPKAEAAKAPAAATPAPAAKAPVAEAAPKKAAAAKKPAAKKVAPAKKVAAKKK